MHKLRNQSTDWSWMQQGRWRLGRHDA